MSTKTELARLARYDDLLSKVMPADFKDWHQNNKEEWPEIAEHVITNLRRHLDDANCELDKLYDSIEKTVNMMKVR